MTDDVMAEADRQVQARQDDAAALVREKLGPSAAEREAAWLAAQVRQASQATQSSE